MKASVLLFSLQIKFITRKRDFLVILLFFKTSRKDNYFIASIPEFIITQEGNVDFL